MKWIVSLLLLANLGVFVWQTYERQTAPPPAPVPVPETDGSPNRLPLLIELDPDALRERSLEGTENVSAERSSSGDTQTAGSAPGLRCYTIGPFKTGATSRGRARTWLEGKGATVSARQDERREVALYWVYFPPAASRAAATARVDELKAKGVVDVLVVPKGDMANAVSLGVFSKSISRDRRMVEMRQKGYQPKVSERARTVKADWLDVRIEDELFEPKDFTDTFRGLELTKKSCKAG